MKFGPISLDDALGGTLAHSIVLEDGTRIRKGIQLDVGTIEQLKAADYQEVIAAMPETGDVLENEAARLIASQLEMPGIKIEAPSTGRVNLFAQANGVFRVSREKVDAINSFDPAITIATLGDFASVNAGRLIATIKIIPYGVSNDSVEAILALDLAETISITPYKSKRVAMIATTVPALKQSVRVKTKNILEARLSLSGSQITSYEETEHKQAAVAEALRKLDSDHDMLILFGASAISDIHDVIPAAIEDSGGEIIRFGMPVDPGNLMLLAELDGKPVLGAPGCARSPAENGFDWVLQRLLADIPVSDLDITGMGVGGLLMETGARPHPREQRAGSQSGKCTAIILAAGQSRRMGAANKMTVKLDDKPLVRHVAEAAAASKCDNVLTITGYMSDEVQEALDGIEYETAFNPDFSDGLSTSLAMGIQSVTGKADHALILLGDMPFITIEQINKMLNTARENPASIIVSTALGKRGNPVLWPSRFFDELQRIEGDTGARHIIGANADLVVEVELGEAASIDLDTPEALHAAGGKLQ